MTTKEIREQFEKKVRAGIFRPVIRHITGNDPEERLAEAVGMTFELYARKAKAGVVLDDAVLVHHCRLRAIDLGRQLVKGGQRLRDAMDPRNFHRGRVEMLRIDGLPDEDGDFKTEEDGNVVIGLADGLAQDPTPRIIGAIDLADWARSLPDSGPSRACCPLQGPHASGDRRGDGLLHHGRLRPAEAAGRGAGPPGRRHHHEEAAQAPYAWAGARVALSGQSASSTGGRRPPRPRFLSRQPQDLRPHGREERGPCDR